MNNKAMLLALFIPLQSFAGNDSVYDWGQWAQGIQPAAGAVQTVTPPPAYKPEVSFRPNENSAFYRSIIENSVARNPPAAAPAQPALAARPPGASTPVATPGGRF